MLVMTFFLCQIYISVNCVNLSEAYIMVSFQGSEQFVQNLNQSLLPIFFRK